MILLKLTCKIDTCVKCQCQKRLFELKFIQIKFQNHYVLRPMYVFYPTNSQIRQTSNLPNLFQFTQNNKYNIFK